MSNIFGVDKETANVDEFIDKIDLKLSEQNSEKEDFYNFDFEKEEPVAATTPEATFKWTKLTPPLQNSPGTDQSYKQKGSPFTNDSSNLGRPVVGEQKCSPF